MKNHQALSADEIILLVIRRPVSVINTTTKTELQDEETKQMRVLSDLSRTPTGLHVLWSSCIYGTSFELLVITRVSIKECPTVD